MLCDANVKDFPRLPGETDDAPRLQRAIDSAPNGIVEIPKGEYALAAPLRILNRASLEMHPAARLKAVRPMDFLLTYDGNDDFRCLTIFDGQGEVYDNLGLFIHGGDLDGNGLASCLSMANGHHFTLRDTAFHNGKKYGLFIGGNEYGRFYEIFCTNLYFKCTMPGLAGNTALYCGQADCHFTDCTVVDYTIGMEIAGSSNRLTRCHIWGGTVPPKGVSVRDWSTVYGERKRAYFDGGAELTEEFDRQICADGVPEMLINSAAFILRSGNFLDGCYADTAQVGYLVENGSILSCCGFYNNPLMGLRESVAFRHLGGELCVMNSSFSGPAGTERLYEGIGRNVKWMNNTVSGGEGMRLPDGIEAT